MLSKVMGLVFFALIIYLGYDLIYGRNGIVQYEETSEALREATHQSDLLQRRNEAVQDELEDLRQGQRAVEELARSELGLIKEDETFYRVIDKGENASPPPASGNQPAQP